MKIDKKIMDNIDIDKMDNFRLARWAALVEGVNIVAEMAEEKKKKFDNVELKPLALMKYIESTCDQICRKMDENDKLNETKKDKRKGYNEQKI